jgi:uncharacterized membrane protein YdjX (TVP38/TMEM64 family)
LVDAGGREVDAGAALTARSLRNARIALVAVIVVALLVAWRAGVFAHVAEPKVLARAIVEMGLSGYVAFIVAYALLQPFGVPGTVFVVAAPLIWPWPIAFALSLTGTMAASVIGFSFARFVARDWIVARIPERFRKYEAALERNAFRTVFVLRLIFWMPQVLHSFFGVSKVRFSTHFWGSLLGYVPPLFLVSYLGAQMFDASGHMQPRALPIMGGMAAFSLVLITTLHLMSRRHASR